MNEQTTALTPIEKMKSFLDTDSVKSQFQNALSDNSPLFVASLIDIYGSDNTLQKCDAGAVIKEALKAAVLKLPINKSLGFAYIVPFAKSKKVNNKWIKEQCPQFQIGFKGLIQLAMRTGAYKYINADVICEGELKGQDKLTGNLDLSGEKTSDEVVGYFAYIETVNGFRKTVYGTRDEIEAHAKKFSQAYQYDLAKNKKSCPWSTNFDAMAIKTMLKQLLGKYGMMSVEMVTALSTDKDEPEDQYQHDVGEANSEVIDIEAEEVVEPKANEQESRGPGF